MGIKAAYLIPHAPVFISEIGGDQVEQVALTRTALDQIKREVEAISPDTILIISPHGPIFSDAIAIYDFPNYDGDLHAFGAFDLYYTFEKDIAFINRLMQISRENNGYYYPLSESEFNDFQCEPRLDHGVTVPLHFLSPLAKHTKIVAMSYGTLSYLELLKQGRYIYKTAEDLDANVVIIASGDMSHALKTSGPYTSNQNGIWFDGVMRDFLTNNKPYDIFLEDPDSIESAKECGLRSYAIMMGALSHQHLNPEVFSYEGPFGVGYLTAALRVEGLRSDNPLNAIEVGLADKIKQINEKSHFLAKFARAAIQHHIQTETRPKGSIANNELMINDVVIQNNLSESWLSMLSAPKGVFVSIKQNGVLRGCMGTIYPSEATVVDEIIQNALMAASDDPRFDAILESELSLLTVSVDVLSTPEIIHNKNMLSPERMGVIVYKGDAYGVLLPNLEGIDTVEEQLKIASNKAGFHVDEIEKIACFTVDRYK